MKKKWEERRLLDRSRLRWYGKVLFRVSKRNGQTWRVERECDSQGFEDWPVFLGLEVGDGRDHERDG